MASDFSKEEKVAFDDMAEGYHDALVMSHNVSIYKANDTTMERTGDIIWRPRPFIGVTYDGIDQTANFDGATQLSVPATIGYEKSAPWSLDALELRDALQEGRLGEAGRKKLASDINVALLSVASNQGTLVIKRSAAASGYDDAAQLDSIMNEQGVGNDERFWALSSRDYNGMASNLAGRETMQGKPVTAYEKSHVGRIAGFETFKLDYARRLAAAAGGGALTMDTRDAAVNYYVPVATQVATTGERSNVDNRYQTVEFSTTAGMAAGDAYTVADLNAVHHITKEDTGQLKTFRVISIVDGTHAVVSPPMITDQVSTEATARYQNCVINTKAANSAIVFLNTVAAPVNPFWHKDAIELIPGRLPMPQNAGISVMTTTTDQGLVLTFSKQAQIGSAKTLYRLDTRFGIVCKEPEMAGIALFSQT